jgi:hypothetical protein
MCAVKWNIDLVKKYIEENGNGDILITDTYKNSNTKLEYKCHMCNEIYSIDWNSFIKGYRHYMCSANEDRGKGKRLLYEDVKKYYEENGYTLVSKKYKNSNKKLETRCPNDHVYFCRFSDFKKGYRCSICSHAQRNINQTFKIDYVKKYILEHGNGDILISKDYIKCKEKLQILCHICNKEYTITFDGFRHGKRCLDCSYVKRGKEKSKKLISSGHNLGEENLDLLLEWDWNKNTISPYEICSNSKLSAFWICIKCGKSYETRIDHRAGKSKTGCPFCKLSKGELEVKRCLENFKINYIPQYKFKDCRYKKLLPFDFYFKEYNTCLEYLGQQHFYVIDFFGGEKAFEEQKRRDKIKKDYCHNKEIKLIEIPYWEFNDIENILIKELNL